MLSLDGGKRYEYFVKHVADWGTAWGLWQGGWALAADSDGQLALALWPAMEYAAECIGGDWAAYEVKEVAVDDLLTHHFVALASNGRKVAVFPTTTLKGVVVDPGTLAEDLIAEQAKFG